MSESGLPEVNSISVGRHFHQAEAQTVGVIEEVFCG